ncbi:YkoY family integral membrane protein [Sporosarcina newyorkensis 2681]|uniref:YkoY family integral membrane protein n=1 Tax=Sporosarcina newyorkensis 2681 TaxID=1027292 RepID=F9DSJ0_9BACL|nr:hypothetical protein [Sporosarcina newyorkensis]EGQ26232.1 YkoY family integral membrane protein [Sporosarcina newyorkensis 2681]
MEMLLAVFRLIYVLIFFIAVFISLKFEWGEESKDERGKSISNKSYGIVFPLMPLGWFLIELYDQFINSLDYDTYKSAIWFLITGLMILHAIIITSLKRKY